MNDADLPGAPNPQRLPTQIVLGMPIHALNLSETVAVCGVLVGAGGVHHVAGINAAKFLDASADAHYWRVLQSSSLLSADGISVVWASRFLGCPLPERVAGIDLMQALTAEAAAQGWPVYLLGSQPSSVLGTRTNLIGRHPNLVIAGARDGYWSPDEEQEIVAHIASSGARIVFVGLPSPAKEFFLERNCAHLRDCLVVGVGGSFDVLSGNLARAPKWVQRLGMEWIYRLAQEPRRLWRRYLVGNVRFAARVLRARSSLAWHRIR